MSDVKFGSEEIPQKFAEWLLKMGCPSEKVNNIDQMCRGQYYMVWRSVIEHVHPKDIVKYKRLQVFVKDMEKCSKKSSFKDSDTVLPEALSLWRQQREQSDKLSEVELQVYQARRDLDELFEKISRKLSERELAQKRIQDQRRRVWLLQQTAGELNVKRDSLQQIKTLADSLCCVDEGNDTQVNIDKCLSTLRRQAGHRRNTQKTASVSLCGVPVASSSLVNTSHEEDESRLLPRGGAAAWPALQQRRAALAASLAAQNTSRTHPHSSHSKTPQSVLTETASLQAGFGLGAIKNKILLKQTQKRLSDAVMELNETVSAGSSELTVLGCVSAAGEARLNALRSVLADVTSRGRNADSTTIDRQIHNIDKSIVSKRDELRNLYTNLLTTERKVHNVKDCLKNVFAVFKDGVDIDYERFRNLQLDFPQESISCLRQFYEERREKRRLKLDLSLDLDVSEKSCNETVDSPTFVDELRHYSKNFHLEKNRKLVLDSGKKIWVFETVQSSIHRLYSSLLSQDVPYILICPSVSPVHNLQTITDAVAMKHLLHSMMKTRAGGGELKEVLAVSIKEEEEAILDKIKKRLSEYLLNIQKTKKMLDIGQENLKFWNENHPKKYISASRTIDGKTYTEYESYYVENISLVA